MASGSPENISWYAFYAGSEFLEITCTVLDCKDIIGVQFGLYELCPCDGGGNCVAGTGNQITTSFTISYTSATIGQIYYLYVDGWAGAECEFEIEFDFATTIQWPCPDTIALSACADIPDAFLPNSFCFPSEEGLIEIEATIPNLVDFTNDTDFKSNTFHWTINSPTGNLLPFENTISTTEPKLEFTLSEPGYWELCLEDAINDCDTASDHCLDLPECIPINVVELANENFGPYEVCLSELEDGPGFNPGFWNGNVWQGPNLTADLLHDSEPFCVETGVCTFTHITTNACGCEIRQNAIINVIGLSDPVPYTVCHAPRFTS